MFGDSAFARSVDPSELLHQIGQSGPAAACETADPAYCSNMAHLACETPGNFSDGTGTVLSKDEELKKLAPLENKTEALYQKSILQLLKSNDSKLELTRKMAILAAGQDHTPDCTSDKSAEQESCFKRVSEILAHEESSFEFGHLENGLYSNKHGAAPPRPGGEVDFQSLSQLRANASYQQIVSKAHKESFRLVSDEKLNKKVGKEVFPRVKEILKEKILANVKDQKIKDALLMKINNITYAGNDCGQLGGSTTPSGDKTAASYLVENAFYDPRAQTFHFCNGFLLRNSSEFAMAMVIGHELSHSIDPCRIDKPKGLAPVTFSAGKTLQESEDVFPFNGIIACLRSKESVGATRLSKSSMPPPPGGLMEAASGSTISSPFCELSDQIGESFSDWMAGEILPEYIGKYHPGLSTNQKAIGFSNTFRNLCSKSQGEDFFTPGGIDEHPKDTERLNRILMANPDTLKMVGCAAKKEEPHHCNTKDGFIGTRAPEVIPPKPEYHEYKASGAKTGSAPDGGPTK